MTEDARSRREVAAASLREAYTRGAIAPLRGALEPLDVDGAYEIQKLNTEYWIRSGRRVVGHKIGLTAPAVQKQLGVDQPDFGVLFDDMMILDGGVLSAKRLLQSKVEGEIAFVMGRDFDNPHATAIDMMSAIAYVLPAIEIVDSRIQDWKITLADTVADNASSAFFVLGTEPRALAGLDLSTCGMVMTVDGNVASIGAGAACLGHPLNAAAWLAATLSKRGEGLRAGEIIMSGALGPMVTAAGNSRVRVKIGGVGSVDFAFTAANA